MISRLKKFLHVHAKILGNSFTYNLDNLVLTMSFKIAT